MSGMRTDQATIERARAAIGGRSVVLVGLMGAGKSSIGRRLAQRLNLPFADADTEIERAAGVSISDIFAEHGEAYFRDGEARVIARLLSDGQKVLATGGGAVMSEAVRAAICDSAISVWLKADIDLLVKRVKKRNNRPLLVGKDPYTVLGELIAVRDPYYALADLTVVSRDVAHEHMVCDVLKKLGDYPTVAHPAAATLHANGAAPGNAAAPGDGAGKGSGAEKGSGEVRDRSEERGDGHEAPATRLEVADATAPGAAPGTSPAAATASATARVAPQ